MAKELLRNGSFERGTLDFWEAYLSSAEIVNTEKKRGTYSAKIITSGYGWAILRSKDYIEVVPHALYKHTGWYKNPTLTKMKAMIAFFDSDRDNIQNADITLWEKSGTFDWTMGEGWFVVPTEASYLRFYVIGEASQNNYGYVDCLSLQEVDLSKIAVYPKELLRVEDLPLPGTYYSDEYFSGVWGYSEFYLNVTSISGTDPKIDIVIQAYDPSTGLWKDIVEYDQVTSTGSQLKVATAGLGWKIRVKYTIHSDTSDADFVVGAIFKR